MKAFYFRLLRVVRFTSFGFRRPEPSGCVPQARCPARTFTCAGVGVGDIKDHTYILYNFFQK